MSSTDTVSGLPAGGFRLDGLTAVVTGASRNIGAAIVEAFASAGADVVLVARDKERLSVSIAALEQRHPERRFVALAADVGRRGQVDELVRSIAEQVGVVDIVVNNAAAIGKAGVPILEQPDSAWDQMYETNVLGPFQLIRGLVRPMIAAGRSGSVLNVLSGAAFQPVPSQSAYGASKAALWMLTRCLARDLAPQIRANAVVPGVVSESGQPRSAAQERIVADSVPFGRVGRPEEIAGAAVYLSSPAASYTSGEVIFCNGARPW